MPGKATFTVELADGSVFTQCGSWSGGNPRFEAQEASEKGEALVDLVRTAIASINGDINEESK